MYELFKRHRHVEPLVVVVKKRGRIVGLMSSVIQWNGPAFMKPLTARSIIMGGPLIVNDDERIIHVLMKEYRKKLPWYVVYSEIRPLEDMQSMSDDLLDCGFKRIGHYNILLDIRKNKKRLYDNLHKERQRNIRQAQKAGLEFREVLDEEEIRQIIYLLKQTYHRKRVPLGDTDFFLSAKEVLKDSIHFFAAYKEDKMVAGQVRLCYKKMVYAWYAGSDEHYFKLRPNDFLMWNVICWAHDNGYSVFDFGGGGEPGKPYGVRDYKMKYGGEISDFGRYLNLHHPIIYKVGKIVINTIKKN